MWLNEEKQHEHPACDNHLCDAFIYSSRESLSYLYSPEIIIDPIKEQEERLLKAHIRAVQDKSNPLDRYMEAADEGWH